MAAPAAASLAEAWCCRLRAQGNGVAGNAGTSAGLQCTRARTACCAPLPRVRTPCSRPAVNAAGIPPLAQQPKRWRPVGTLRLRGMSRICCRLWTEGVSRRHAGEGLPAP